MQEWLVLGALVAEVMILSRLDRQLFGTWITPFTVLGYPYAAVILLACLFAEPFDFVPLYLPSVLVWIVGLFIVWASGAFLGCCLLDLRSSTKQDVAPQTQEPGDSGAARLATISAWTITPLMVYGVFQSARVAGGWWRIGTQDFKDAYSQGLHAHAVVLATLIVVVLIGLYQRGRPYQLATIAMLLPFIVLTQVKGTILQTLIGGLMFRVIRGVSRLSIKALGALAAMTYAVFNMAYMIGMFTLAPEDAFKGNTYTFLARHYLYYLLAGPLALGEAMRSGITDIGGKSSAIFAPFINLYHVVLRMGALVPIGSSHTKG
ncbi:MAG: DUF6337 family protein, partial [Terriglobales bacterium]